MRGLACFLLMMPAAASGASVTVAWDPAPPGDNVVGWKVYYDTDSGPPYTGTFANEGPSPIDVPVVSLADANAPQVTLSGIDSCTLVYFTATAYNDTAESDYAVEISFIVSNKPTLQVLRGGASTLSLVWSGLPADDSGSIAGYRVWYATASSPDDGVWPPVYAGTGATEGESGLSVSAATTSLLLHGLTADATYYARVSSYCNNGGERWSAEGSAVASACNSNPECDDALSCNGSETCDGSGRCQVGTPRCATTDTLWCTTTCSESSTGCNELDPLRCLIGATCERAGVLRPSEPCQECVPATSTADWSPDDSNRCDDGDACTSVDSCLAGTCQPGTDICVDAGVPDAAGTDAASLDAAGTDAVGTDAAGTDAAGSDATEADAAEQDAAVADSSGNDAAPDAAMPDTSQVDAGHQDHAAVDHVGSDRAASDQAVADSTGRDSAVGDSAVVDSARPDTAGIDLIMVDAGRADAGTGSNDGPSDIEVGQGCTCRGSRGLAQAGVWLLVGLVLVGWRRRS